MNKLIERNDILTKAKQRGQGILVEVERPGRKDNPLRMARYNAVNQHRNYIKNVQGGIYDYTLEHPELCPPIGTVIIIRNEYGIKAKITVTDILNGLPVTTDDLLPIDEQPEHFRDPDLLKRYERKLRVGWHNWPDEWTWEKWQQMNGRSIKPWMLNKRTLESKIIRDHFRSPDKNKKNMEQVVLLNEISNNHRTKCTIELPKISNKRK